MNLLQTFQSTIRQSVTLSGIGLHSGKPVNLTLVPQGNDYGIRFARRDNPARTVKAIHRNAQSSDLQTVIEERSARFSTIEHLMAALNAMGVDNVLALSDSEEIPAMDGSSKAYVAALQDGEVISRTDAAPRRYLGVRRRIKVEGEDGAYAMFKPNFLPDYNFHIDFNNVAIGKQHYRFTLRDKTFETEVASARTFGFLENLSHMRSKNLALGAGCENAIVLDGSGKIHNPEGLRYTDEFVRHKLLDAIGDTFLAGYPLIGSYIGHKAGHRLNLRLVRALFSNPANYAIKTLNSDSIAA